MSDSKRVYLPMSLAAYENIPVPAEVIAAYGPLLEYSTEAPEAEPTEVVSPTIKRYHEAGLTHGGSPIFLTVDGVPFVMTKWAMDRIAGDTPAERRVIRFAAKSAMEQIFAVEGTNWKERFLNETEARDFIAEHTPEVEE